MLLCSMKKSVWSIFRIINILFYSYAVVLLHLFWICSFQDLLFFAIINYAFLHFALFEGAKCKNAFALIFFTCRFVAPSLFASLLPSSQPLPSLRKGSEGAMRQSASATKDAKKLSFCAS